jgi:hypothetical protein
MESSIGLSLYLVGLEFSEDTVVFNTIWMNNIGEDNEEVLVVD